MQDRSRAILQNMERVLQLSMADGSGADDERTVRNGFGDGREDFGVGEDCGCSDGRASLAKCRVVWMHQAQMMKAEVAHGTRGRPDVQRVSRRYENHAEAVGVHGAGLNTKFT